MLDARGGSIPSRAEGHARASTGVDGGQGGVHDIRGRSPGASRAQGWGRKVDRSPDRVVPSTSDEGSDADEGVDELWGGDEIDEESVAGGSSMLRSRGFSGGSDGDFEPVVRRSRSPDLGDVDDDSEGPPMDLQPVRRVQVPTRSRRRRAVAVPSVRVFEAGARVRRTEVYGRDRRRVDTPWTERESNALVQYIQRMGPGNWARMLQLDATSGGGVLQRRTNVDLKDKARDIAKKWIE